MHTLITFLDRYIYVNKKISVCIDHVIFIEVHVPSQERDQCVYRSCPFYWSTCAKPGKWSVCVSILTFLLKYMYQARKVISVCIDLALFIEVHVPNQESDQCVYRSCPFYWSICTKPGKWSVCASILSFLLYMYFNKKGKIDTHTDHFPGFVHVLQ
jgi:predicted nucleic acid-binding Zn finger protein